MAASPLLQPRPDVGPGRAGLTSKPHHDQQPRVALRGSFRLRLASTFNHRPAPGPNRAYLLGSNCPGAQAGWTAPAIYGCNVSRDDPRDWESPTPRRATTWFSNLNARVLRRLESKIDPENLVEVADRQLGRSQRHSGETSRASAAMLQTKARYLRQAGRIDEALIVSNSAFSQRLQYQGAEHPDTLDTELRLAVLLAESSRFEDAEPHFAHVVDASARLTNFDHASASLAAKWLAYTRRMLERDDE